MKNSSGRKKESGSTFGKKSFSKSDSGEKRSYSSAGPKRGDDNKSEGGEKKRRFNKPAAKREGEERAKRSEGAEGSAKKFYSKDSSDRPSFSDREKSTSSREGSEKRPYGDREKSSYSKDSSERRSYSKDSSDRPSGDREKRSYSKDRSDSASGDREKRSYSKEGSERRTYSKDSSDRPSGDRERRTYSKDSSDRPSGDRERRTYSKDSSDRPSGDRERRTYSKDSSEKPSGDRERRTYSKDSSDRPSGDRERRTYSKDSSDKPSGVRERRTYSKDSSDKPSGDRERRTYSKDSSDKPSGDRERRTYSKDSSDKPSGDRERRTSSREGSERKPYGDREKKPYGTSSSSRSSSSDSSYERKPYKKDGKAFDNDSYLDKDKKSKTESWDDTSFSKSKSGKASKSEYNDGDFEKEEEGFIKDITSESKKAYKGTYYDDLEKNPKKKDFTSSKPSKAESRQGVTAKDDDKEVSREQFESYERRAGKPKRNRIDKPTISRAPKEEEDGLIRLNKYIANSGVCSRREADKLIESGAVKVNGNVVSELGYKVQFNDEVHYGDQPIKRERHVYVLLNKPKDYITTLDDPEGRKTVMELIKNACKERIYPVGRLDRNTTGLLLFTNDGEMTMKLTHPKNNIQKLYSVELDKSIKPEDFKTIMDGMELEDGFIKPDKLEFVGESTNRREIGIEIHSGRNRIVRRMFESLGYKVVRLDRVMFAGLTKKDLPRSRWRLITEKELSYLKMIK